MHPVGKREASPPVSEGRNGKRVYLRRCEANALRARRAQLFRKVQRRRAVPGTRGGIPRNPPVQVVVCERIVDLNGWLG